MNNQEMNSQELHHKSSKKWAAARTKVTDKYIDISKGESKIRNLLETAVIGIASKYDRMFVERTDPSFRKGLATINNVIAAGKKQMKIKVSDYNKSILELDAEIARLSAAKKQLIKLVKETETTAYSNYISEHEHEIITQFELFATEADAFVSDNIQPMEREIVEHLREIKTRYSA